MSSWQELSAEVLSAESWKMRQSMMTFLHVPRVVGSLDEPVMRQGPSTDAWEDLSWADRLCVERTTPETLLDKAELKSKMNKALTCLLPRERFIILWHTLGEEWAGRRVTLEEIGEALGVTRERVRQLEVIAKAKLRWELNKVLGLGLEEPKFQCDICRVEKGFTEFPNVELVRMICRECGEKVGR